MCGVSILILQHGVILQQGISCYYYFIHKFKAHIVAIFVCFSYFECPQLRKRRMYGLGYVNSSANRSMNTKDLREKDCQ